MSVRQRARFLVRISCILVFLVVVWFLFGSGRGNSRSTYTFSPTTRPLNPEFDNLLLTESQCKNLFPHLTKEIETAKSFGPFDLPFKNKVVLQAKIENGELYILSAPTRGDLSATMLHRQSSSVNQIYRALKTSPEPLPNVSFALGAQDQAIDGSMAFARPVISPSQKRIFPMPHFSFWSWPLPFINSLPAAAEKISELEERLAFRDKDLRPVWRGTTWFNNGAGSQPRLRHELVKIAGGKEWADVQALEWETNAHEAKNALNIEDFCRYKYIIHTEGIGYSGRLQFHQLCESVVLSPPLDWMQHTTHLVRPAYSSTILGKKEARYPTKAEKERWPTEYPLSEANMIFIASDWSDLEDLIAWLEEHQELAAGVARRQRQTYHDGGYLSAAAEVCYWRSLLRGWAEVARPIGEKWTQSGMPVEKFISGGEREH